jgi:choline dehydrogenase-like flavoprotein
MLADARRVPAGAALEADLCIIGAGAAGITLAREFIGTQFRVILLESGGLELDQRTQELYKGRSIGLPYFPLDAARLRYFGGSTNHWGGVCRPFDDLDFERRDWIPFSGWPIRRSDLDPYYPPAVDVVRLLSQDFSTTGWDERDTLSPLDLDDRTVPRVAQFVGQKSRSMGTDYRDEIRRAANVRTYLRANVEEIETDGAARAATQVRVVTLTGNRFSVNARHFVLAVGGIENPRLLLASNRQQPRGLGNQHDLVGRFFLEHPRFAAGVVAPADAELNVGFYEPHHAGDTEIQGYVAFPPEVQRAEGLVDVQVFLEPTYNARFEDAFDSGDVDSLRSLSKGGGGSIGDFGTNLMNVVTDLTTGRDFTVPGAPLPVPYPDVVGKLLSSPSEVRDRIPDLLGDVAAWGYKRLTGAAPLQHVTLVTRLDPAPNPASRVTLATSRDALGMPRAQLDWRLSSIDRHSTVRATELLGAAFARAGLGRVRLVVHEDDRSWPSDLAGGYHHMGTTRMSDDPKQGVVDRDCRVHGMTNLFIAGSSVFPTGGSSPPTLTITALALRLSDHLQRVMR